jgi:hypothetical protein
VLVNDDLTAGGGLVAIEFELVFDFGIVVGGKLNLITSGLYVDGAFGSAKIGFKFVLSADFKSSFLGRGWW